MGSVELEIITKILVFSQQKYNHQNSSYVNSLSSQKRNDKIYHRTLVNGCVSYIIYS